MMQASGDIDTQLGQSNKMVITAIALTKPQSEMESVLRSSSLASFELLKIPRAALKVGLLEAAREILCLNLTRGGIEVRVIRLRLNRGSLFDRSRAATTEEHAG